MEGKSEVRWTLWKRIRPGNYLRELSVVILGVFITLTASTQLTTCSKKNEYRQVIEMVYSELVRNKTELDNVLGNMSLQREMERYFFEKRADIDAIPTDTLYKYQYVHHQMEFPIFTDHALEVLKFSSAIYADKDIRVVRDIMEAYDCVKICENYITLYYETKNEFVQELTTEVEIKFQSVTEQFDRQYNSTAMDNYVSMMFSDQLIEECKDYSDKLGGLILQLQKKYKLK